MQRKTIDQKARVNSIIIRLILLILLTGVLNACVTNRKVQYLQMEDVNPQKDEIEKDSVLRNYLLTNFEYKIQSEDVLSIQFKSLTDQEYDFFSIEPSGLNASGAGGSNQLLRGYLVDEEGNVEFPVVGSIKVAGLTVYEAQNKIQKIADQYLENPVVDVRLLNFRFVILGEVDRQGAYTSYNNRTSLLEAIGMAGGLGELADRSNIKLIRQKGNDAQVFYINLLNENFVRSELYYINQNDVIIVPPLKQRPFRMYFSQNLSILISSLSFFLLVYGVFIAK